MFLSFDEREFDNELIHYLKTHYHTYKNIKRTQTLLLFGCIYAYYDVTTKDNTKYRYQVSKNMKNQFKIVTLI